MIGQKLGSFLIEEQIGAGAMGVVYRALHEKTGRSVALKVIIGEAGNRSSLPERFDREAKILQNFSHPHIVKWLGHGRYKGTGYFAMEYLTGGTLEDVITRKGPMPWRVMVDLGIQIADALHYAHENNVVHRDLKPSNLLFSESRQIKLTDFGIAKDLDPDADALTATGRTLGTSAYMAPEQIRGTPSVSHKTDLYALGCLFYQMLTGETPFRGTSAVVLMHLHLAEPAPRPSGKATDIPKALDNLILQLMAKETDKRPRDALKVRQDLIELRDKAKEGPVVKVFDVPQTPGRLGVASPLQVKTEVATSDAPKKERKSKSKATAVATSERPSRKWIWETAGLAAAFVALLSLVAYYLWPAGAKTLYTQASAMMASENPTEWSKAERDPIAELDHRFPDLYTTEKAVWRDKIALEKTRRRAAVLEKPNLGRLSEPSTDVERMFVDVYNESSGASKAGRDEDAMQKWQDMAEITKRAEDRGWALLASDRASTLKAELSRRTESVIAQLEKAKALEASGKTAEAEEIRKDVIRRYGKAQGLKKLIEKYIPAEPADAPKPET